MASSERVARTIWNLRDGNVSNLVLQKLLYLAHMVFLGEQGRPLVSRPLEAWDFGPIEPALYRKLKPYGSLPVADIFVGPAFTVGSDERETIARVVGDLEDATPGRLVALTHWPKGAWAKNDVPGARGIVIPDEDVAAEYRSRFAPAIPAEAG